jgi:hypothetical protein
LHRRFQPTLDVQQYPGFLTVLAQSRHQEAMIEIVVLFLCLYCTATGAPPGSAMDLSPNRRRRSQYLRAYIWGQNGFHMLYYVLYHHPF